MSAKVGNRDAYIGERRKQVRQGYGVYNYENEFFRYEGEWKNGCKHGHGRLSMADGGFYEGEFDMGEIEGHGTRLFAQRNDRYSGQFHMGERHGQGIMNYNDGTIYEGDWIRNLRQGYGIWKAPDKSIYQGNLFKDKRHGEGTQVYSNGDRFDGDWIQNKRQGHGELRCRDGTIYDGQWSNDLYNGQGSMTHSSGVIYEGLWINGRPAVYATHLAILEEGPIELHQGQPFIIHTQCRNDAGDMVEEHGREIEITAGFRYIMSKELNDIVKTSSISDTDVEEKNMRATSSELFDVIEDVEETPIQTPFGYAIVSFPLTDQMKAEDIEGLGSRSQTFTSDLVTPEEGKGGTVTDTDKAGEDKKFGEVLTPRAESTTSGETIQSPSAVTSCEDQAGIESSGMTLAPPVSTGRTDKGTISFDNLVLPAAPPMYRPYILLDLEEKARLAKAKASRSKGEDIDGSRPNTRAGKKDKKIVHGDERFSRPVVQNNSAKGSAKGTKADLSKSPDADKKDTQFDTNIDSELSHEDSLRPSKFALPGEYIIMVKDVTEPPFMGVTMKPAFIQVKVMPPKKVKKPSAAAKKDTGPRT